MYCPHCHTIMHFKLKEDVDDFSISDAFDAAIEDVALEKEGVVKVYRCKNCGFIIEKEE